MKIAQAGRTRYFATGAVVAAAGALAVVLAFRPARADEFATLKILSGTVSVSKQAAPPIPAADGMSLKAGDVVQTGDPGRALVRYFDGSETRLDSKTRFELRELNRLKNAARSKIIRGKQSSGATFNRIVKLTDSQSRMEIEAPTSTAAVRGTAYSGTANADGSWTWRVFEGRVKITDKFGKSVILEAGFGVVVDAAGHLLEPYPLSDAEKQAEWIFFNNCKLDGVDCPSVLGVKKTGGPGERAPASRPGASKPGNNSVAIPFDDAPAGEPPGSSGTPGTPGAGGTQPGEDEVVVPPPQPGSLDHLRLAPATATIPAQGSQVYTAEGFDQFGNSLGDRTVTTVFTIAPDGSCAAAVCTASIPGLHTVTGIDGTASGAASLTVTPGVLASIVISPSGATIAAGGRQAYTAAGFDPAGNPLGDVTAGTIFAINGAGACEGPRCGSNFAGTYTVTGTNGGVSDTATLTVVPGALASITLDPGSAEMTAGGSQAFTARAFDSFGNLIADVTTDATFTIELAGGVGAADAQAASCTRNVCTAFAAGDYTVTGSYRDKTATAVLTVHAGALASITISPPAATITAGMTQIYTAEGFDASGNSLGAVTAGTSFGISGSGTCAANACGSTVAGQYTITGTNGVATDTASLTVQAGDAATLVLSPASATVPTGGTQSYTASAFDQFDNPLGDVTGATIFTISGDGTCSANACGSSTAGTYTVTGTHGGAVGTASLTVTAPPPPPPAERIIRLRLDPAEATIALGSSQSYRAVGLDAHGAEIADVTGETIFSIVPAGSCDANVCSPGRIGEHTVHGAFGNKTATAKLVAVEGAAQAAATAPDPATRDATRLPPAPISSPAASTPPGQHEQQAQQIVPPARPAPPAHQQPEPTVSTGISPIAEPGDARIQPMPPHEIAGRIAIVPAETVSNLKPGMDPAQTRACLLASAAAPGPAACVGDRVS